MPRDQLLMLCACSTHTLPDTNSSGFLLDAQKRRSGRFSANDLLGSSTASKHVTKTIIGATARFFAPTHTSPQHLWLEDGLFTGPNDAATPRIFRILGSRAVGENRVDVLIAFKEDWGDSEGDVTAILENNRWVIDDYLAMYENDDLQRLSAGYSECKGGQWVSETPY